MSAPALRSGAAGRREALLHQLAYLLDEVEALRLVVRRVPEAVLSGRPLPSDRSIKEMYGLLAAADAAVFLPLLERMAAGEEPVADAAEPPAEPWNDLGMDAILDRLRDARTRLVAFLEALPAPAWERPGTLAGQRRDVYGVAYYVVQHDTEWLRAAGYRLHESRLTDRADDLPR